MSNQTHWQDDFARTAAILDFNLIMLHRFLLQLDGEERQRFDRLMNDTHKQLVKLVNIINPTWINDADEPDFISMISAGDTSPVPNYETDPVPEFESNADPGDEQPS